MTEEEFAKLPLSGKWSHLSSTMDYIVNMDKSYNSSNVAFALRRRYNPHHSEDQVEHEKAVLREQQRNLRIDQYQRWAHVKALYSAHRDELANTLDNDKYAEHKNIMEKIFTLEVDDALRTILENND